MTMNTERQSGQDPAPDDTTGMTHDEKRRDQLLAAPGAV